MSESSGNDEPPGPGAAKPPQSRPDQRPPEKRLPEEQDKARSVHQRELFGAFPDRRQDREKRRDR